MKSKTAPRLSTYSPQIDFEDRFVRSKEGPTLVAGSRLYGDLKLDRRTLYPDAIGWDAVAGEGVDQVIDIEAPLPIGTTERFDHIDCLSVLEHSRKPWDLAANLERLLKDSGTLYVTVPFAWRIHNYPSDYWRFTANGIRALFPNITWAKILYAHRYLSDEDTKLPALNIDDFPYFPRSEVFAFGRKL